MSSEQYVGITAGSWNVNALTFDLALDKTEPTDWQL